MKRNFEMPVVNVERFEVTDVITASGFLGDETSEREFDMFKLCIGDNDTRLG